MGFAQGLAAGTQAGTAIVRNAQEQRKEDRENAEREVQDSGKEALESELNRIETELKDGKGAFAPLRRDAKGVTPPDQAQAPQQAAQQPTQQMGLKLPPGAAEKVAPAGIAPPVAQGPAPIEEKSKPVNEKATQAPTDPFSARGVGRYRNQVDADNLYYDRIKDAYKKYMVNTRNFDGYLKVDKIIETMRQEKYEPKRLAALSAVSLGSVNALKMASDAIYASGTGVELDGSDALFNDKTGTYTGVKLRIPGSDWETKDVSMQALGALLGQISPKEVINDVMGRQDKEIERRKKVADAAKAEGDAEQQAFENSIAPEKWKYDKKKIDEEISLKTRELSLRGQEISQRGRQLRNEDENVKTNKFNLVVDNAVKRIKDNFGYSERMPEGLTDRKQVAKWEAKNALAGLSTKAAMDILEANSDFDARVLGTSWNAAANAIDTIVERETLKASGKLTPELDKEFNSKFVESDGSFAFKNADGKLVKLPNLTRFRAQVSEAAAAMQQGKNNGK